MTHNITQHSEIDYSKWEHYEGLPPGQEDDLYLLFIDKLTSESIRTYKEANDYFQSGSDSFTNFILNLEERTTWFDYTQINQVLNEINLYIEQLKQL